MPGTLPRCRGSSPPEESRSFGKPRGNPFERLHDRWIEMRAFVPHDEADRLFVRNRLTVKLPGGGGIVDIHDRDDSSGNGNVVLFETFRVTGTCLPALAALDY